MAKRKTTTSKSNPLDGIRALLSLETLYVAKRKLQLRAMRHTAFATLSLFIVLQVSLLTFNYLTPDRPILGLHLEQRSLNTWTGQANRERVATIIAEHEAQPITVFYGQYIETLTFRGLGEQADPDTVYNNVLKAGRTGSFVTQIIEQNMAVLGLRDAQLARATLDQDTATTHLQSLAEKIANPAVDASFSLIQNEVSIIPEQTGSTLDARTSLTRLLQTSTVQPPAVLLASTPVPAKVTSSDLLNLLSEAQKICEHPIVISANDQEVTISKQQLVDALVVTPSSRAASLSLNEPLLKTYMGELVSKVSQPAQPTYMNGPVVTRAGAAGLQTKDSDPTHLLVDTLKARQNDKKPADILVLEMTKIDPPVVQQQIANNNTGTGLVRLTFDDGPGGYTNQVLDILKNTGVHATFYVVGREVPKYAATAKRIVDEGHQIGNHTYNHPDLTKLSLANVQDEISRTQNIIQQYTGVTPIAFRPPYGAHNPAIRNIAANMGLSNDLWSIDSEDWKRTDVSGLINHILANVKGGSVILLHSIHPQTVTALPAIIQGIRDRGYTLE